MSTGKHTPGPWGILTRDYYTRILATADGGPIAEIRVGWIHNVDVSANASLIAAAPDLLEANQLQEAAENAHANCPECEGEGVPELCERCFPLFDDARVKRRIAIAKATGAEGAPQETQTPKEQS